MQWSFPYAHSRNTLAPPLFCLRGPWGPDRRLRGSPMGPQVQQSHNLIEQKRQYKDLLCCRHRQGRFQHLVPQLGVPGAPLTRASHSGGEGVLIPPHRDSGHGKPVFTVCSSLILRFPVADFLSQSTECEEMPFANNSMFVESQDGITLYSLNTGTFYGKLRPEPVPLSQLAPSPSVGKGRTALPSGGLACRPHPALQRWSMVVRYHLGVACLSLTRS